MGLGAEGAAPLAAGGAPELGDEGAGAGAGVTTVPPQAKTPTTKMGKRKARIPVRWPLRADPVKKNEEVAREADREGRRPVGTPRAGAYF